jgi:hypothetical protein
MLESNPGHCPPERQETTMRFTDDRYAGEQARFELAMRLIGHQARTHIITRCTGFSQDRIRKLYATYFKHRKEGRGVKRHRGKSPSSVEFFVRNPVIQAEASLLAHVFAVWELLRILPDLATAPASSAGRLAFGQRFCDAYEEFRLANPGTGISFEHAWGLLDSLAERDELRLFDCADCATFYVQDALVLDGRRCPACRVATRRRARHGAHAPGAPP